MKFSETELNVLRQFARINPSQIITPTGLGAREPSNSIVGVFKFEEAYDFEPFGIYEVPVFLQALDTFDKAELEIKKDRVVLKEGDSKVEFFTTPLDLLKDCVVPEKLEGNFEKLDCELDFDLSADKLATIQKTASVFKAKYLYFESTDDAIVLTVSADELGTSANSFQVTIRDNIRSNDLGDQVLKIPLSELRVTPGDYSVAVSTKKITKWESFTGVKYYVGAMTV